MAVDVTVTDPIRIVSIGGAVTEILYALGKEKTVVGVDSTSLYPPRAAAERPSVGYMRQLSAEGVLGLRPSLILAIEGNRPEGNHDRARSRARPLGRRPGHLFGGRDRSRKFALSRRRPARSLAANA